MQKIKPKQNSNRNSILFTENEESLFNDPDCDAAVSYSSWGPCLPKCKNSDNEMGIRKRKLKYNSRKSFKECGVSVMHFNNVLTIIYNDADAVWMFWLLFSVSF